MRTTDALLDVWTAAQQEPLHVCAASALCRLLRCHPALSAALTGRPAFMQQVLRATPLIHGNAHDASHSGYPPYSTGQHSEDRALV